MAALSIGTPFLFKGKEYLDTRQGLANNLEDLRSWQTSIPEGFEVYVKSEKCWYQYQPNGIEHDDTGYFKKRNAFFEQVENRDELRGKTFQVGSFVYIEDEDAYFYYSGINNSWILLGEQNIVTGNTPPENKNKLWIDTTDHYFDTTENAASINRAIRELQEKVDSLMTLKTNGIVSGTVKDSVREEIINSAEPEAPEEIEETEEDDYSDLTEVKPNYQGSLEPTVKHISIKMGTWDEINNNRQNLIYGELIWCTDRNKLYIYINGTLTPVGSGNSNSGDNTDDSMTEDQIRNIVSSQLARVTSIGFVPFGSTEMAYKARVNEEGKFVVYESELDADNYIGPKSTYKYVYNDTVSRTGLIINSFYLGGSGTGVDDPIHDEHSYLPCSHNFIELANVALKTDIVDGVKKDTVSSYDISLNGFYLFYYSKGTGTWSKLKLWGKVPAGGTFLIRGDQCSVMNSNTTVIKVENYDMQWPGMKFDSSGSAFYICQADAEGKIYCIGDEEGGDPNRNLPTSDIIDVDKGVCAKGYIDLASYNITSKYFEKKTYKLPEGKKATDVIFRRWYLLDPVTQSNPKDGIDSHNNTKYFSSTYLSGGNIGEDCKITEFTPKASFEKKSIANTRTLFSEDHPSSLTCTFGCQATYDETNDKKATRCFCWNSVGYYDEFISYHKIGTSTWTNLESIKDGVTYTSSTHPGYSESVYLYSPYYTRVRWISAYGQDITTHRVLIGGLTDGTYEYKVIRKDSSYESDVRKFVVKKNSAVSEFSFIQVTDQQGANWEEYEVWNLSARIIAGGDPNDSSDYNLHKALGKIPSDYQFIINTGDICYNGSRSNEWLDYYKGYLPLKDKPEMLTIGNNDLAPITMEEIGSGAESPYKINTGVIDYFYTYEIDVRNPQIFTGKSATGNGQNVTYKMPSLYSFDFGDYHFISLCSEMRTMSTKTTYSDGNASSSDIDEDGKTKLRSTVNTMFGILDELRDTTNKNAAKIYDVEEEWIIKDLLLWKGKSKEYIDSPDFNWKTERFNSAIVDKCRKCVVFTHEMPFNIISDSSYKNYKSSNGAPRETAKAYLNRYHNFEFQRSFKIWGIPMVMGGHKHTCAITQAVYDAPLGYNPITKKVSGSGTAAGVDDIFYDDRSTGMFSAEASFQPFMQVTPSNFNSIWDRIKNYCSEVYNNSSSTITVDSTSVSSGQSVIGRTISNNVNNKPIVRLEVVTKVTAPSYVMCQATGFKNKSNSDLAASVSTERYDESSDGIGAIIPWERFYVDSSNIKEQSYPFFTVYTLTGTEIVSYMYQIKGMYDEPAKKGSSAGYWDLAKYYTAETLDENRRARINKCSVVLYNQDSSEQGTQILI